MDTNAFEKLSSKQKAEYAVAYAYQHKIEIEGTKNLIARLATYESKVQELVVAHKAAKEAIEHVEKEVSNLDVAIGTVVGLIADEIPEDKIKEYCLAYEDNKNEVA